nr:hypothetical protein [Rhodococcus qingshengii]
MATFDLTSTGNHGEVSRTGDVSVFVLVDVDEDAHLQSQNPPSMLR